jgi:hypothetical protein
MAKNTFHVKYQIMFELSGRVLPRQYTYMRIAVQHMRIKQRSAQANGDYEGITLVRTDWEPFTDLEAAKYEQLLDEYPIWLAKSTKKFW